MSANRPRLWAALLCLCVGLGASGSAQQDEQVTVPFSNPSRPGTISVKIVQGSITVRGANRKDVLVVTRPRNESANRRGADAQGLRRLTPSPGFLIEEEFNEMSIGSGNPNPAIDFEIQVPTRTHLRLSTVNSGEITVEAVDGNIEIENANGGITLTGVSGSVVAGTTNGNVIATLLRVTAEKAMAFTSLNGTVDVTLPAATKANLKLRSDNGNVYTDLDLALKPPAQATVRESQRGQGRYRVTVNRSIYGSINGGGPDIELRTFNSNVYLRRGK